MPSRQAQAMLSRSSGSLNRKRTRATDRTNNGSSRAQANRPASGVRLPKAESASVTPTTAHPNATAAASKVSRRSQSRSTKQQVQHAPGHFAQVLQQRPRRALAG